MKKDFSTVIIGLLFLAAGIVIGGTMLGYFNFSISLNGWWTLFIILPALFAIAQGGFNLGNIILLTIGILLLLDQQDVLPRNFSWRLIFPLVLLGIGLQVLMGDLFRTKNHGKKDNKHSSFYFSHKKEGQSSENKTENTQSTEDSQGQNSGYWGQSSNAHNNSSETHQKGTYKTASVLFSGQDIVYGEEFFSGASYTAVFGGLAVDLQRVIITEDITINVSAIFGGIDLFLPPNIRVVNNITPILGGVDLKKPSSKDPLAKTIYLTGIATFGGIDIK